MNIPKHNELPVHGLLYDTETAVPEPNDVSEAKKYAKQKVQSRAMVVCTDVTLTCIWKNTNTVEM